MTVNKCDVAVGRSVYTPLLTDDGGFRSDLTIVRLAENRFRIATGAFDGGRDEYWFRFNLPASGVAFENRTEALAVYGVWGPDAVALLQTLTETDLSQAAFRYGQARDVLLNGIPTQMLRISYIGDSGFEIYCATSSGLALWDAISAAGRDFELRPVGAGVYGTTGRLEKGYRLMGAELESDYSPVEAGLARPKVKAADFIGKEAYLTARAATPTARLCLLRFENLRCAAGYDRFPTGAGNEPILLPDGERITDSHGRVSRLTTAGNAPSVNAYLGMGYLPTELATVGAELAVMYQHETYPVTVAATGANLALFDPDNSRMKA